MKICAIFIKDVFLQQAMMVVRQHIICHHNRYFIWKQVVPPQGAC